MNFTLSNGVEIPAVGIGTFTMTPVQAEQAVAEALSCGYSLVDTANAYMNEKAVGRGIRKSGVDRNKIFLSTKLWPTFYEKPGAVEKSLELLGTDYVDLLFIHQPAGNFMAGYRQLEEAYRAGKIRAIGISNFHDEKLKRLLAECEIKPHVIQYEAHPYYTAEDVRAQLKDAGTRLMAWYPLGHGDKALLNEPLFARLGKKYGKSSAQIILRWHTQMGFIVIPGSTNPEHIRANAALFDFELTADEMADIAGLNKNVRYYVPSDELEERYGSYQIDLDAQA